MLNWIDLEQPRSCGRQQTYDIISNTPGVCGLAKQARAEQEAFCLIPVWHERLSKTQTVILESIIKVPASTQWNLEKATSSWHWSNWNTGSHWHYVWTSSPGSVTLAPSSSLSRSRRASTRGSNHVRTSLCHLASPAHIWWFPSLSSMPWRRLICSIWPNIWTLQQQLSEVCCWCWPQCNWWITVCL